MKTQIIALVAVLGIAGCSSAHKVPTSEDNPDRVISRSDELSSRPSWLKETVVMRVEDGHVLVLGQTTIPGGDRVEAAYRIADSNAKVVLTGAIEQRFASVFQNAEEGTSMDGVQARHVATETANIVTSQVMSKFRYWEKVATTTDSGERITKYRVFALVSMPEQAFKQAVAAAMAKVQGESKSKLSPDFQKKADAQWDKLSQAQ